MSPKLVPVGGILDWCAIRLQTSDSTQQHSGLISLVFFYKVDY